MADTKISALTASTTPLAGTEVLPIVQSGVTKQVSVDNLTTGRAISATQLTLTTGSVIVASGQGIDFSATSHPAGMTSELLNDYEEGTWTPSFFGSSASPTVTYTKQVGTYTKVGRQVTVNGTLRWNTLIGGLGRLSINGIPFTSESASGQEQYAGSFADTRSGLNWSTYTLLNPMIGAGTARIYLSILKSGADSSEIDFTTIGAAGVLVFTVTYFV